MSSAAFPRIRTVAFWLQLVPGQQLVGEGICMHMIRLLAGIRDLGGIKVVLCAPFWSRNSLENLLAMGGVRENVSVKYFGPKFNLELQEIRKKLNRRHPNSSPTNRGPTNSNVKLLLSKIISIHWIIPFIRNAYLKVRDVLLRYVCLDMARYIDNSSDIDVCIVPLGSWHLCRYVKKKPIVAQIPDVILIEFPTLFGNAANEIQTVKNILAVSKHAARLTCPSEYVRSAHHLVLGIPASRTKVIRHAPVLLNAYIEPFARDRSLPLREAGRQVVREFFKDTLWGSKLYDSAYAEIPNAHQRKNLEKDHPIEARPPVLARSTPSLYNFAGEPKWLETLDHAGANRFPVFYFPTQNRPYKNIQRVIECISRLKTSFGQNPLLILTADLTPTPNITSFIRDNDLYANILCLPRLSNLLHAAMYAFADLTISASQFEGGFPFLYWESLSMGTPTIMADIPVVREILPETLIADTLFDPHSTDSLVRAVCKALDTPQTLIKKQKDFLEEQIRLRSWKDVAREYLQLCDESVEKNT